jgi:hypothetical protein
MADPRPIASPRRSGNTTTPAPAVLLRQASGQRCGSRFSILPGKPARVRVNGGWQATHHAQSSINTDDEIPTRFYRKCHHAIGALLRQFTRKTKRLSMRRVIQPQSGFPQLKQERIDQGNESFGLCNEQNADAADDMKPESPRESPSRAIVKQHISLVIKRHCETNRGSFAAIDSFESASLGGHQATMDDDPTFLKHDQSACMSITTNIEFIEDISWNMDLVVQRAE